MDADTYLENSRSLNRVTMFVTKPVWVTAFGDVSLICDDWSDFDFRYSDSLEDIYRREAA